MSSVCRSCGAAIIWAVTAQGRPFPLDAIEVPGGQWHLVRREGEPPLAEHTQGGEEPGYRPHWATCPQAVKWRQQRRKRA